MDHVNDLDVIFLCRGPTAAHSTCAMFVSERLLQSKHTPLAVMYGQRALEQCTPLTGEETKKVQRMKEYVDTITRKSRTRGVELPWSAFVECLPTSTTIYTSADPTNFGETEEAQAEGIKASAERVLGRGKRPVRFPSYLPMGAGSVSDGEEDASE